MESDFEVPERRSGTLFADRAFDDRLEGRPLHRDIGRLLIACPYRPGIVAAVSRFLFDSGANIIESQQYSTDPFGGTFFLRVEFHLDDLADQFDELESQFAPLSGLFAMRWRMARAGVHIVRVDHRRSVDDLRQPGRHVEREVLARAVGWHLEDRVIVHQNKTIVFA